MALVHLFLVLFFLLGLFLGPLFLAISTRAFSPGRGRAIGRWAIRLAFKSVYRPAVTFNAADELTLKRRSYDEDHNAEYIRFGGLLNSVKRYVHDPQDRIHSFYGVPFGFVDELFGVVVDPRDVALGRALRTERENNQYTHRIDDGEQLHEAVKAVFDLPQGQIGVRLADAITLVGGSFDSQVIDRIREMYEKSQSPKTTTAPLLKLLLPLAAFIGVVMMGSFIAGQGTAGGGGGGGGTLTGGNVSRIGVGASMLLLLAMPHPRDINWRDVVVGGGYAVLGVGFAAFMVVAMPVEFTLLLIPLPLGAWAVVMMALGIGIVPFVAFWFGRSLGGLGVGLGKLYLIIGLLPYEHPVVEYREGEYTIVEYDSREWAIEPKWYRFAFTRIGISFDNCEDNWPDGTTLSYPEVEAMADAADKDLEAPTGHVATELIGLADIRGFVPEKPDEDAVFVRTDRTTGWLLEAGQARRLMAAALQSAKEEFGGGRAPVGDKWILGGMLLGMAGGAIFDMVVFF